MKDNDLFYNTLKVFTRFEDLFDSKNYMPVPSDWYVVLTDVVNSTRAIMEGHYKDVNTAGGYALAAKNLKDQMKKENPEGVKND